MVFLTVGLSLRRLIKQTRPANPTLRVRKRVVFGTAKPTGVYWTEHCLVLEARRNALPGRPKAYIDFQWHRWQFLNWDLRLQAGVTDAFSVAILILL